VGLRLFPRYGGINRRSAKDLEKEDSMSRITGLLVVIAVLVVGMVGGLFYLDRAVAPEVQAVEKVLPDGQFPR
tara:strand:+ start:199629 stop:199847 length:219 start_codon:yes stop_codon:yes gene_type:complete